MTQFEGDALGAYPGHVSDVPRQRQSINSSLYLTQEVNDLGRSVIQHKPLQKGEHAQFTLTKTFDDPAMRPKVRHHPVVDRPPPFSLTTDDIQGAQPKVHIPATWNDPRTQPPAPAATKAPPPMSAEHEPPRRSAISISDIEGSAPKARCSTLSTREVSTLRNDDVEGSRPGWKNSWRDPECRPDYTHNVKDINNYMPPKSKTLFQAQPQALLSQHADHSRHADHSQHADHSRQCVMAEATVSHTEPQETGSHYTGLPQFQTRLDVVAAQRRDAQLAGQPQAVLQAECMELSWGQQWDVSVINQDMEVARALQKKWRNTPAAHSSRVALAEERKVDKESAVQAVNHLDISQEVGEKMLKGMRKVDRQGYGKLTVPETVHAMRKAGLDVDTQQIRTLIKGLRDNVGLFEYRELSKLLLARGFDADRSAARSLAQAKSASTTTATTGGPRVTFRPSSSQQHRGEQASPHTSYAPPPAQYEPMPTGTAPQQYQRQYQQPTMPTGTAPQQYQQQYQEQYQQPTMAGSVQQLQPPQLAPTSKCVSPKAHGDSKYFAYKADPYWFGGRAPQEELAAESVSWKAAQDHTHSATQHHVSQGDVLLLADPGLAPGKPPGSAIYPDANLPLACGSNTLSSAVRTGAMAPEQLASTLKSNRPRPPTAAETIASMVQRISAGRRPATASASQSSSSPLKATHLSAAKLSAASQGSAAGPWAAASRPVSAPADRAAAGAGAGGLVPTRGFSSRMGSTSFARKQGHVHRAYKEDVASVNNLL